MLDASTGEHRDDSITCGQFGNEGIDWCYQGRPGWSRTTQDHGAGWDYTGPLDEFGRTFLLGHFGLNDQADTLPVAKLTNMSPADLRALANRQHIKVVSAA